MRDDRRERGNEPGMLDNLDETDLKLLRVFQTVVRCGGFSAAQAELNSSQSTISTQMAQLESRLEMHLCDRGQAGFRVTKDGETVLEAADNLFGALEDFQNRINESRTVLRGEIRLGCIDNMVTNPAGRIPLALGKLKAVAPDVRVNLFIGDSADLESRLLDGRLHVGVGLFSLRLPGLRYKRIFTEEHALYCAHGHPLFDKDTDVLEIADLQESDYVGWGYLENRLPNASEIEFKISSSTPFMEGVALLIQSGRFIGFLPTHYAERWEQAGSLQSLLPEKTTRVADVLVATRKGVQHSRLVRHFLNELDRCHSACTTP